MDPEENVKARMALFKLGEYLAEHVDRKTGSEILRLVEEITSEYITFTSNKIAKLVIAELTSQIKEEKD